MGNGLDIEQDSRKPGLLSASQVTATVLLQYVKSYYIIILNFLLHQMNNRAKAAPSGPQPRLKYNLY